MPEPRRSIPPALIAPVAVALLLAGAGWWFYFWWHSPQQDDTMLLRENISALAPRPDWSDLDAYQETITRESFTRVLQEVYSQGPAFKKAIGIGRDHAEIRTGTTAPYRLRFAKEPGNSPPERYWRSAAQMPLREADFASRPLQGIKIAIDPGHIGGPWAKMEERWYQIGGEGSEVKEGELTLQTAKILAPQLAELGAEVVLLRTEHEPLTQRRPEDFLELAGEILRSTSQDPSGARKKSEIMFYRWSEIRARAKLINEEIKPDLTLCLHYNAEGWGNPAKPQLTDRNHLHLIINGTYSNYEFSLHDQRLDLMKRLLQRIHPEELAVSSAVADSMAAATALPAYRYTRPTAKLVGDTPYVYARNLMANRIYYCPVVFLEPYVMNSEEIYQRIGAGDYQGERLVAGKMRKSLFREYADGVATGLADYYREARPRRP